MKKLNSLQKLRHVKHIRRRARRKKLRAMSPETRIHSDPRLLKAVTQFQARAAQLPKPKRYVSREENRLVIECPDRLSFFHNREETLGFFEHFLHFMHIDPRRRHKVRYIDFDKLETVSLGAMLVLAAELDCTFGPASGRRKPGAYNTAETDRWFPHVAKLFSKFGILELLKYRPANELSADVVPQLLATKFERAFAADGQRADKMIEEVISHASGPMPEELRTSLYEALAEAMDNVCEHAYPDEYRVYPGKTRKLWWGSGAYDTENKRAVFVVYDRGVGIHKTIPRKNWFGRFLPQIEGKSDGEAIKIALEEGKTQTGAPHRGRGLPQMYRAVSSKPGSKSLLRIHSGNSVVICESDNNIRVESYGSSIRGTLIEWFISDE